MLTAYILYTTILILHISHIQYINIVQWTVCLCQFLNFEPQLFLLCANCSYWALPWQPDVQPVVHQSFVVVILLTPLPRCTRRGTHLAATVCRGFAVDFFLLNCIYAKKKKKKLKPNPDLFMVHANINAAWQQLNQMLCPETLPNKWRTHALLLCVGSVCGHVTSERSRAHI